MAFLKGILISLILSAGFVGHAQGGSTGKPKVVTVSDESLQIIVDNFDEKFHLSEPEYIQYLYFYHARDVLLHNELINGGANSAAVEQSAFPYAFRILGPLIYSEEAFANKRSKARKAAMANCKKPDSKYSLCGGFALSKKSDPPERCNKATMEKKGLLCEGGTDKKAKAQMRCNPDWFCSGKQATGRGSKPNSNEICVDINGTETNSCMKEYAKVTGLSFGPYKGAKENLVGADKCNQLLLDGAQSMHKGLDKTRRKDGWQPAWYNAWQGSGTNLTSHDKGLKELCDKTAKNMKDAGCDTVVGFSDKKIAYSGGEDGATGSCSNIPAPKVDDCAIGTNQREGDVKERMAKALSVCRCSEYPGCMAFKDLLVIHADRRGIDIDKLEQDGKPAMMPPRNPEAAESANATN